MAGRGTGGRRAERSPIWGCFVVVTFLAAASAGCQASLPAPVTKEHKAEALVPVPYPPPPARAEVIPEMPTEMKDPVWIDGDWQWKGRRWVWQPGQWIVPDPALAYAIPKTLRLSDGTLGWYPGKWVPRE